MGRDRLIQLVALVVLVAATSVSGALLPRLIDLTQRHALRYTDVAVEGAPLHVALGTAIGALRGIIVDWLWIKVHFLKEKGLYYEVMADSELITKLQPRFAAVWAFLGHNMAYNISVIHNTREERWEWVTRGIDLVRNQGLRYNPNDLQLHRELAFWFLHKIEGVADDAHFYYKTELAREWHAILGEPPYAAAARLAWITEIAGAPETLDEAERRTPGVKALYDRLSATLSPYQQRFQFKLDARFLRMVADRDAIRREVPGYAQILGVDKAIQQTNEMFRAFDAIASDPSVADAWRTLIAHVRKRVLIDEYNMSPKLMAQYTRDYGPIDWRHGAAHALYWALKGTAEGEDRIAVSEEDVYRIVNNDRTTLQAMQELARSGRIGFDPYSTDLPSRLPDPRWIAVIDRYWEQYSVKHQRTRGPGPDLFIAFHQNFLSSSVRQLYRCGESELAQHYLDRLNSLYGTSAKLGLADPTYALPLEIFVWDETKEEYVFQPHMAPSDVAASLYYGLRIGIGQNRPEVYHRAKAFANKITEFFHNSDINDFKTKMDTKRLGDIVSALDDAEVLVFAQLLADASVPLLERLILWSRDEIPIALKQQVYDDVRPEVERQFNQSELSRTLSMTTVLPEPPGMEAYRLERAAREAEAAQKGQQEEAQIERK